MTSLRARGTQLSVIVVAEVRLYREGLAAALPKHRLTLAGTASNRAEASAAISVACPDVVIVDVRMRGAFELMREVRASVADTRLIAFAVDDDVAAVVRCAEAGASGYVSVNGELEDLVVAVESAAHGELLCSPRVAAELFRRVGEQSLRGSSSDPSGRVLTNREQEVLMLLRRKLSNKQIAVALNIAEATVKNHVHRLLEKLRVSSRNQAATFLLREDDLTRPDRPSVS